MERNACVEQQSYPRRNLCFEGGGGGSQPFLTSFIHGLGHLFIQHILIERTLTVVTAMDRHDLYLHQDYSIKKERQ